MSATELLGEMAQQWRAVSEIWHQFQQPDFWDKFCIKVDNYHQKQLDILLVKTSAICQSIELFDFFLAAITSQF
jgi:hypothetical protein